MIDQLYGDINGQNIYDMDSSDAWEQEQEMKSYGPLRFTPENITRLAPNEYFVFGSNLNGWHSKGAALTAKIKFGAVYGVPEGITGRCYALPTVGYKLARMSLKDIEKHVKKFLECAKNNPDKIFLVTLVGCGLAGHKPKDIGPMFSGHQPNVVLPKEFIPYL